jgi:rRNA maturation endonuclease Nob1
LQMLKDDIASWIDVYPVEPATRFEFVCWGCNRILHLFQRSERSELCNECRPM